MLEPLPDYPARYLEVSYAFDRSRTGAASELPQLPERSVSIDGTELGLYSLRSPNVCMGKQERAAADRSVDDPEASMVDSRRVPDAGRRRVLTTMGGSAAIFLAGCLNEDDADDDDVATYEVVFVDGDETFDVDVDEDEELLYPALDAGVDIPYACEAGTCGQCTAKYDGDADEVVTHEGNDYLDDNQIADGWLLTCVAYPRADSELEVAHPDDA